MNAPKPMLNANTIARPRDIDGRRSTDGGSSGTSPRRSARFSTAQVAAPRTTARASDSQVHHPEDARG
ncbi:hypothetical protein ACFU53_29300 [Streptomyces sp. NPDC057474]|uniref:hypothetical protein n=1 Tax=Streptomyces sp. NPDC057474 TaxID=3346144 RepID=UPI00369D5032